MTGDIKIRVTITNYQVQISYLLVLVEEGRQDEIIHLTHFLQGRCEG